jgi:hypothetical protein
MFVGKVTLRNVRGFEELDFDLQRPNGKCAGWTVITGDNGSGKSALLKAIALGLAGRDVARSLQPSMHRWIRQGASPYQGSIQLEIVPETGDDSFVQGGRLPLSAFPAKLLLRNGGKDVVLESTTPEGKSDSYRSPDRSIWSSEARGWYSCGYGPFRRVFGASPAATRLMTVAATARFVTMFEEAASLAEADQWLRNLKYKALEEEKRGESEGEAGKQLEVLLEILRDGLMPNQITVDRVDSDGLWLKDRNDVELSWSEMSDGYRSALALLADIVRHMIGVYGTADLTMRGEDGKLRISRSGVVLIDEVDAHLHPEWQRELGFWLKDHFPKVQFLVTSHSPLICQAADENGLFVLPEPGSDARPRMLTPDEQSRVIASRPDTILLSPAFGLQNTRSPLAVAKRKHWADLQAKQRAGAQLSAEERSTMKQLELFAKADGDD